ncbi:MAG: flagellar basal body protein [Pseudomonadota bacterium]
MGVFADALSVPTQALALRAERAQLIASNLANADTPNYQARDIDFRALMMNERRAVTDADRKYRVPLQPSLDGNTVESHVEQMAYTENAIRYQGTVAMMNARIRGMLTAITGGS